MGPTRAMFAAGNVWLQDKMAEETDVSVVVEMDVAIIGIT